MKLMDRINNIDLESIDAELFGFGDKYESTITTVKYSEYFKSNLAMTAMALWETMVDSYRRASVDAIKNDMPHLEKGIAEIKTNIINGLKKVPMRKVSGDSMIVDDAKYKKLNEHILQVKDANNDMCKSRIKEDPIFNRLVAFNNNITSTVLALRKKLKDGITEVKKDK